MEDRKEDVEGLEAAGAGAGEAPVAAFQELKVASEDLKQEETEEPVELAEAGPEKSLEEAGIAKEEGNRSVVVLLKSLLLLVVLLVYLLAHCSLSRCAQSVQRQGILPGGAGLHAGH
jgi:hypothetical protein